MKIKKSLLSAGILGAVMFGAAPSGSVLSRIAPMPVAQAQAFSFGVVDEDKLAENYKAYRAEVARLDQKAKDLDAQLAARELLNAADSASFDTLIVKARTVPENATLKTLVDRGTASRARYQELIAKETKNNEEKTQMSQIETTARANADKLRTLSDTLYNGIKKEQETTDKTYIDKANDVIAQVAGDKKMALVLRQRAIIWSNPAIDITDDVLARLNK